MDDLDIESILRDDSYVPSAPAASVAAPVGSSAAGGDVDVEDILREADDDD